MSLVPLKLSRYGEKKLGVTVSVGLAGYGAGRKPQQRSGRQGAEMWISGKVTSVWCILWRYADGCWGLGARGRVAVPSRLNPMTANLVRWYRELEGRCLPRAITGVLILRASRLVSDG